MSGTFYGRTSRCGHRGHVCLKELTHTTARLNVQAYGFRTLDFLNIKQELIPKGDNNHEELHNVCVINYCT